MNNIPQRLPEANAHQASASQIQLPIQENADGSAFYEDRPDLTDVTIKALCKASDYNDSKHLKAAMIGQWVYKKEKMLEVYAAMKKIKSGVLKIDDIRKERQGWYTLFERVDFDKEECFKIMQDVHQQYVDLDRVNRQSDNQKVHNVNPQPDIQRLLDANRQYEMHRALNYNEWLTNLAIRAQANQIVNNNNNNVRHEEVNNSPRKKKKTEPDAEISPSYKSTGVSLTRENATINLAVIRSGVLGIISNVEGSPNSRQNWITIQWNDGRNERLLSTNFDLLDIYIASLQ